MTLTDDDMQSRLRRAAKDGAGAALHHGAAIVDKIPIPEAWTRPARCGIEAAALIGMQAAYVAGLFAGAVLDDEARTVLLRRPGALGTCEGVED